MHSHSWIEGARILRLIKNKAYEIIVLKLQKKLSKNGKIKQKCEKNTIHQNEAMETF